MTVRELTPPPYEPVSLAQARLWLRADDDITLEDPIILMLIAAMRRYAENLTGRAFVQRGLELILDEWPCPGNWFTGPAWYGIELPYPPLVAVTSVTYVDNDGATQVLAADQYASSTWREPGLITPAWGVTWPYLRVVPGALRIAYSAGYAPLGSPVDETAYQAALPENLGLWIRARLATFFANREQLISAQQIEIPRAFADGLLDDLVVGSRIAG